MDVESQRLTVSILKRVSSRPAKATPTPSTVNLCDLPTEVRQLILGLLLSRDQPLEFNHGLRSAQRRQRKLHKSEEMLLETSPPTSGLCPQILATCKLLHAEGSEILYSNTINCRINEPYFSDMSLEEPTGLVVLSPSYLPKTSALPKAILQKISRVRIQVFAHHQRNKRNSSLPVMREGMQRLATMLRKAVAWKIIKIEMLHIYNPRKIELEPRRDADAAYYAPALEPWRYVRHRTAVDMIGVGGDLVSRLPALITSDEPCFDLPMAMAALKEYMEGIKTVLVQAPDWRTKTRKLCGMAQKTTGSVRERAVRHEDLDMFLRGRNKVMEILSRIVIYQQRRTYQHDSDTWPKGPIVSHHRNNKLLKQLEEEHQPPSHTGFTDSDTDSHPDSNSDWNTDNDLNASDDGTGAQQRDPGYDDSEESEYGQNDSDDHPWNDEDEDFDSEYGWGPSADEYHGDLHPCQCGYC